MNNLWMKCGKDIYLTKRIKRVKLDMLCLLLISQKKENEKENMVL